MTSPNDESKAFDTLIPVASHAVFFGGKVSNPRDDAAWTLKSFQKGEAKSYIRHIEKGVELAGANPRSPVPKEDAELYFGIVP